MDDEASTVEAPPGTTGGAEADGRRAGPPGGDPDPLAGLPAQTAWPDADRGVNAHAGRSTGDDGPGAAVSAADVHDDGDDLPIPEGGLLTPGHVARLFGVDPKTVSRWGQQGRLPMRRTLGGHRRFPAEEVYALLEQTRGRSD